MALPEGITTCTVTAGVPVTHGGGAVKTYVSIEPSVFLVHTATGTPLVDFLEELQIAEGVAGQFTLPHTDQPGFQDENGNTYTNWYYTARVSYSTPSKAKTKAPKIKVFQLATGQTLVDLDGLPGGAPALPYTAPLATVTSWNGATGAVAFTPEPLPARLEEAALNATIGQRLDRPASIVAEGDSNTVYDQVAGIYRANGSWFTHLCALSGQRLRYVRNLAVAGATTGDVLGRIQAAIALNPTHIIVSIGGNDITQSIPTATTRANLIAIWSAIRTAGIIPIAVLTMPKAGAGGIATMSLNAWITVYCQQNGITVVDSHSAVANPATGALAAQYDSGDGIHLNADGQYAVGQKAHAQLSTMYPASVPYMASSLGDPADILQGYGTFSVDSNADGLSDGWTSIGGGTVTYTRPVGGWQKIERPLGTTGTRYLTRAVTSGWAPGDRLALSGEFSIAGDSLAGAGTSAYVFTEFNGGAATPAPAALYAARAGSGAFYMEGTVPAGATTMSAIISIIGPDVAATTPPSISVRRFTILNLTALGLA